MALEEFTSSGTSVPLFVRELRANNCTPHSEILNLRQYHMKDQGQILYIDFFGLKTIVIVDLKLDTSHSKNKTSFFKRTFLKSDI